VLTLPATFNSFRVSFPPAFLGCRAIDHRKEVVELRSQGVLLNIQIRKVFRASLDVRATSVEFGRIRLTDLAQRD
jgi:hypothetical protein